MDEESGVQNVTSRHNDDQLVHETGRCSLGRCNFSCRRYWPGRATISRQPIYTKDIAGYVGSSFRLSVEQAWLELILGGGQKTTQGDDGACFELICGARCVCSQCWYRMGASDMATG